MRFIDRKAELCMSCMEYHIVYKVEIDEPLIHSPGTVLIRYDYCYRTDIFSTDIGNLFLLMQTKPERAVNI